MARRPQHHDGCPPLGCVAEESRTPVEHLLNVAGRDPVLGEFRLVVVIKQQTGDIELLGHLLFTQSRYNVAYDNVNTQT